jgi:hypothetical protein
MLARISSSTLKRSPWKISLVVLCIALLTVGGVLAATHTHTHSDASHQDCGLCVTAHMAVQVAAAVTYVFVFAVFARIEVACDLVAHESVPQFALFSRPPPADLNCA